MKEHLKLLLVFVVPVFSLIIGIATLNHYGINWDEPYHYRRGQAFLQYYLTGQKTYNNIPKYPPLKGDSDNPNFRNGQKNLEEVQKNPSLSNPNFRRSFYQDDSWNGEFFIDIENSYGHPALNGVLAAISNKIFYQKLGILGDLESYRFFIILIVSFTILFIAIFMWKEFGIADSFFATLALATYPLFFAEQHFDIKDPLETSFYALTIVCSYLGVKKNKLFWLIAAVIFFSLALSTKFNIIFSIIPLGIWFIYYFAKNSKKINKKKIFRNISITLAVSPFIIFGALIFSYPTLWKNPINGLTQIVRFYFEVGFPKSLPAGYYFFGFFNALPSIWITITTPPIEIFLGLISLIFAKRLIKKNSFVLLLFLWILVAVGRNSFFHALNYAGVRLIMEYIPALSMLVGISAGYLIKIKKSKNYLLLSICIILLAFIPTLIKLIKIHPNENIYFNFLIGGLSGAKAKEIPSWGNSDGNAYYGGLIWINENAEKNAKVSIPVGNTSNIPRFKLRPDITVSPYYWSGLKHEGEYLIELIYDYPPMNWFTLEYLNNAMTPVYEVKVDGVAIAKVWKNDLAHVKQEFTKTKEIDGKIKVDQKTNILKIEIPDPQNIMKVQLTEPTQNCSPLKTGYVTSSIDSVSWTRENEDIAVDQLNREEIKKLDQRYEFMLFKKYAKYIIFNVDNKTDCLLKATSAKITILIP